MNTEHQNEALLDLFESLCNLRLVVQVNLQDIDAIGARVARAFDLPAFHLESLNDLAAEETCCACDECCFLRHFKAFLRQFDCPSRDALKRRRVIYGLVVCESA